ncbi:MAG: ROK family protein [Pirellulales bacterium]|nr:ROK family protein [Pirellulales bacterium]
MFLGIEIGGTKLQLGVGAGDGSSLVAHERVAVEPEAGAKGIRQQIEQIGRPLIQRYEIAAVGVGFGGPVDASSGRTITSHQVAGWDDFPLTDWCRRLFGLPAALGNDSDLAGLAEARFGAGRGRRVVFYTNAGSGIGGALVIDGRLYHGGGGVASEIGHLRPGLQSDHPDQTIESIASGWGIAAAAQARLTEPSSVPLGPLTDGARPALPEAVRQRLIEREEADEADAAELLEQCEGQVDRLTAAMVGRAAGEGNQLARGVFQHACQVYGWAIAQMITLLAPEVVVIGGGVSLVGEEFWLAPLRQQVARYVFPPLKGTVRLVPAELGEEVVLHGALAIATAS